MNKLQINYKNHTYLIKYIEFLYQNEKLENGLFAIKGEIGSNLYLFKLNNKFEVEKTILINKDYVELHEPNLWLLAKPIEEYKEGGGWVMFIMGATFILVIWTLSNLVL